VEALDIITVQLPVVGIESRMGIKAIGSSGKALGIWNQNINKNTAESSTFGSEIVALKNSIELLKSLRYKLRMFGVPLLGPADIFCDNEAVVINCSTPESTIKKKHHSIAYHHNREAVASGLARVAKEDSETNLADLFTKLLSEQRRNFLIDRFMYSHG
jgi:hypothetical protein